MATTPSLSSPVPAASVPPAPARLRAVDRDDVAAVARLLPPGVALLPAPPDAVPVLPGGPRMVGYLVLVPADRQPPFPQAAPADATDDTDAPIRVDPARRTAEAGGRHLDLTYLEFELLAHLVAHPDRVHTRDRLVSTVWGYGHVGDGRTVDVHIARLRRKLGPEFRDAIRTVRRVGYTYVPPARS